jgi:hypothetical protein
MIVSVEISFAPVLANEQVPEVTNDPSGETTLALVSRHTA